MGSRIALGLAVTLAALAATATSANAAAMIMPSPTCCTFEAGPWIQDQGETSILDNTATTSPHDIQATATGPDGNPLFRSEVDVGGGTEPVDGTQYLAAGTYPFFCTIHGPSMKGDLTVTSNGTPARRPSVKVSFVKQKLKQVRKSGVRVKLTAPTASKGVTVVAKKGKVRIGAKRGLAFKAGQTRTVTIPLTKAGRKAISKGKVIKIAVQATVPYGKPSNATRKLR